MMQHGFLRHGVMVAFESFEEFRSNHEEIINLFRADCDDSDDEKSYENDGSFNYGNLVTFLYFAMKSFLNITQSINPLIMWFLRHALPKTNT